MFIITIGIIGHLEFFNCLIPNESFDNEDCNVSLFLYKAIIQRLLPILNDFTGKVLKCI